MSKGEDRAETHMGDPFSKYENACKSGKHFADLMSSNGRTLDTVEGRRWVCLCLSGVAEHTVASFCKRNDIPFFLPLLIDESEEVLKPLFPGYLFCRLSPSQEEEMERYSTAVHILVPDDEQTFVSQLSRLSPVNALVASPYDYAPGDVIEIINGPFVGTTAIVLETKKSGRVRATVLPGRQLAVEISPSSIIPTAGTSPTMNIVPVKTIPLDEDAVQEEIHIQLSDITAHLIKYLAGHPNLLYELSPRRFEELVAELLSDMGYEVHLTPQTRDGGRDVFAIFKLPPDREMLTLVECKRLTPPNKVGVDVVERFLWTIDQRDRANGGLIATTSFFSAEAKIIAHQFHWKLSLYDFDALKDWLRGYGKWTHYQELGIWLPRGYQTQNGEGQGNSEMPV